MPIEGDWIFYTLVVLACVAFQLGPASVQAYAQPLIGRRHRYRRFPLSSNPMINYKCGMSSRVGVYRAANRRRSGSTADHPPDAVFYRWPLVYTGPCRMTSLCCLVASISLWPRLGSVQASY